MTKHNQQFNHRLENQYAHKKNNILSRGTKRKIIIPSDTAKALVEAGTNMANQQADQDMLAMLKQINEQLKQMQSSTSTRQHSQGQQSNHEQNHMQQNSSQGHPTANQTESTGGGSSPMNQTSGKSQKNEKIVSEELNNLFSQLLKNQKSQQNQFDEQSQDLEQNQSTNSQQGQTSSNKSKNGAIAVQTAAQVLAEAQYELANELDESLKKLKQVISESEKIANKISNLLGEDNTTNK